MSNRGFHTLREVGTVTVTRRMPPRFDVVAEAFLPPARKGRLAHQIRQDLWRALQGVRGFTPVVTVSDTCEGVHVRAGGQVDAKLSSGLCARVEEILHDPAHIKRWMRNSSPSGATMRRSCARVLLKRQAVD